ncbi:hypothetical protein GF314_05530 [bacterium]|nr:hypothetical protein [bacterium]
MMRRYAAILIPVLGVLVASPAEAAFENFTVDPRARAMGETGVSLDEAGYAATVNPAGLGRLAGRGAVAASYVQPFGLDFHGLYYLGAALPVPGRSGGVGVALRQYGVEFEGVDLQTETTLSLSYGVPLYEDIHSRIAVGVGLNVMRLEFGETVSGLDPGTDTSLGVDAGLMATLHDHIHMGVLVHNVNAPKIGIDEEELPRRIQAGLAYEPYTGVVTVMEMESLHGGEVQWHGGIEVEVVERFVLRTGLLTRPNKLTAGFGYTFAGASLNYGFSTGGGVLDSSHQFGLGWAWGGE